jgi:hypothetical protein
MHNKTISESTWGGKKNDEYNTTLYIQHTTKYNFLKITVKSRIKQAERAALNKRIHTYTHPYKNAYMQRALQNSFTRVDCMQRCCD